MKGPEVWLPKMGLRESPLVQSALWAAAVEMPLGWIFLSFHNVHGGLLDILGMVAHIPGILLVSLLSFFLASDINEVDNILLICIAQYLILLSVIFVFLRLRRRRAGRS